MPNLVLDLRKNGGGSDFSYHPLLPYLYTQPVIGIGVDVWATKDNIANWKRMIIESPDIPESSKADARELLVRMGAHLGHFVLSSEDDTSIVDNPSSFPQKVVILIDGQCASSTEQFLLWARQSKRVTLMGSHTDGVLDYSNVRSSITPCKEISIFYATTRSRRIDKGMAIDNIGIKPDIVLPENSDWIEAARKYLEK
jgi:C-terminal processing protease CtpA/Prc